MAERVVEVSAEIKSVETEDESELWEARYKVSRDDFPTWQKALDEGARRAEKDLVQDVCLRFLESPPRAITPTKLKHWLRVVMKHMSIDQHRYWVSRSGEESRLAVPGPREWQLEPYGEDLE